MLCLGRRHLLVSEADPGQGLLKVPADNLGGVNLWRSRLGSYLGIHIFLLKGAVTFRDSSGYSPRRRALSTLEQSVLARWSEWSFLPTARLRLRR